MSAKRITAAVMVAVGVALPLVACGSRSAPVMTTVTATTTPATTSSSSCTISGGYENWESCWKAEQRQHPTTTTTSPASTAAHPKPKDDGLPWWAWLLIVPVGLVAMGALAIKLMEANDERTIARANARVDELDARHRTRFGDDDDDEDVEDYPDDDDELDEEDMAFLRKATEPVAAPVTPAPPAAGNLLSSLRNQGGAQ